MLTSATIRNYKSIEEVTLDLGRVNVLIGENGAGKSNILEAIAMAGAAHAGKLGKEFLSSRGIRVTASPLMRAAFEEGAEKKPILVSFVYDGGRSVDSTLKNDNTAYAQWETSITRRSPELFLGHLNALLRDGERCTQLFPALKPLFTAINTGQLEIIPGKQENFGSFLSHEIPADLDNRREINRDVDESFVIYSPENTSLRTFEREGQIEPLGINGEGLFKLLGVMAESEDKREIECVKRGLRLFGWFEDFEVARDFAPSAGGFRVKDRFVVTNRLLDHKSVNEGFLFLLFYGALFASRLTPKFFAVDNIDASLNPKLCQRMITFVTELAKENDKQVIMTTHNPAVLDGLNLDDDEQRLFVVSRNTEGKTRVKRVNKPRQAEGEAPLRLSEAFLRGALGGLPKGF